MPSGQLVSQGRKGETYWYHLDGLGSTVAFTDESGRVRNRYSYDDFGRTKAGTAAEIVNRYAYTGQAWDATAGLYHYKARYYNPDIGRFITQDTYKGSPWAPWTQHLYAYVGNNPVNYVDPTGHVAGPAWDAGASGHEWSWITITIRAFLPYDHYLGFHGDGNRDYSPGQGTSRVTQTILVDPERQIVMGFGYSSPTIADPESLALVSAKRMVPRSGFTMFIISRPKWHFRPGVMRLTPWYPPLQG